MKKRTLLMVTIALFSVMALSGCGSSGGSGGDQTANDAANLGVDNTGVSFVGSDECIECHEGFTWSGDLVEDYLASPHVAAASCEACHGAGGEHYGIGPMPTPTPGIAECSVCHNEQFEKYADSLHAGSINDHMGDHLPAGHACVKCHTDEGALVYVNVDNADDIWAIADGSGNSYTPVQCRTCHDPHNPQQLLEDDLLTDHILNEGTAEEEVIQVVIESAEYRTCMNCHGEDHLEDGASWTFRDTHFDLAATDAIEGYVVDMTVSNSCTVCHDVHSTDIKIQEQWAISGHAGEIAIVKELGGVDAAITLHDRHSATAFTEFNYTAEISHDEPMGMCQRCHTATGGKNYLSDPEGYDPANNDFGYLMVLDGHAEVRTDIDQEKREMLYCTTCHVSATTGELRSSGADITLDFTYNDAKIVLAGVNESKVCLSCHGGWGNNDTHRNPETVRDYHGNLHHGPAGAILFADQTHAAYEFDGQDYSHADPHSKIGTTNAAGNEVVAGTGTAGPCVACHMPDGNHSNAIVDGDTITSQTLCNSCHVGGSMTAAKIVSAEAGRSEVATLIDQYLMNRVGTTNFEGVDAWAAGGTDADGVDHRFLITRADLVSDDFYRAFLNWWVVYDDFGGHVHNPTYIKQIAFDTIDYLADKDFDGTITIDVVAWPEAAVWLGANLTTGVATRP